MLLQAAKIRHRLTDTTDSYGRHLPWNTKMKTKLNTKMKHLGVAEDETTAKVSASRTTHIRASRNSARGSRAGGYSAPMFPTRGMSIVDTRAWSSSHPGTSM